MKRNISVALTLVLLLGLFAPVNVSAKSKSDVAKKAYQKYLKKYESQYTQEQFDRQEPNKESYKYCASFAIIDMNGDKIPELVTEHCNGYKEWEIHVFTYKKGKVKELTKQGISTSNIAGGSTYAYFCSQNHLHIYHYDGLIGTEDTAYQLSKSGKISEYIEYSEYWYDAMNRDSSRRECYMNGKKISLKQYKKLFKKCGQKDTSFWKLNTETERKNLLK